MAQGIFEPAARARLEQRRAEAEVEFHRAYKRLIDSGAVTEKATHQLVIRYASARFFALAKEALEAYVDTRAVRQLLEQALPILIERAFLTKHRAALLVDRKRELGRFYLLARFMITNSPEWLELQEALVERAKAEQSAIAFLRETEQATIAFMAGKRPSKGEVVEITSLAKPDIHAEAVDATPMPQREIRPRRGRPRLLLNHHPEVEGHLDDVTEFAKSAQNPYPGLQRDITITDFCLVSGFGDDTVFGAWRRGDTKRCPDPHARKFEATLELKPVEFLERLNQRCR